MRERIAIVGLACRLPGASSPEELWRVLLGGGDAISEVPADRWDASALFDPELVRPGSANTRWGGFVRDVLGFDAPFFGISSGEAAAMDPQQRLLLQLAWAALEHAGIDPTRTRGGRGGVFVGVGGNDYELARFPTLASMNAYTISGNALCMIANRVSHVLDWRGPSMNVDTGCSASLTAVHLACQSLLSGDSELALAGGVSLSFTPRTTVALAQAWMTSGTGRCHSFDRDADGYVRGEGAGLFVLRRLDDARRRGEPILAVLRGSAVNHGGRGKSLTAPRQAALEDLLERALADGSVGAAEVDYVEAHGVGTPAGDGVEAAALARVFAPARTRPRYLGSVKAAIGHLEWASGVASLAKAALAIERGIVPPQPNFRGLPDDLADLPFEVPRTAADWPGQDAARRALVSAFGLGGANACVVLEEAPPPEPVAVGAGACLYLVSAHTPRALARVAALHAEALRDAGPDAWRDAGHTSRVGRAALPRRAAVVATSRADLIDALEALAALPEPGTPATAPPALCARAVPGHDAAPELPALDAALARCRATLGAGARTPAGRGLAWQLALLDVAAQLGHEPTRIVLGPGGTPLALVASGILAPAIVGELLGLDDGARARRLAAVELASPRVPLVDGDGAAIPGDLLRDPARFVAGGAKGGEGWTPGATEHPGGSAAAWASLGEAWTAGAALDLAAISRGRLLRLPTYPFELREHGRPEPFALDDAEPDEGTPVLAAPSFAAPVEVADDAALPALTTLVREAVAELLDRPPAELEVRRGFFDLGLGSLQAVELRHRLQRAFGDRLARPLPTTLALEHPTIDDVARHLAASLRGADAPRLARRVLTRSPATDEPIAIVGMACRFPGAPDVEAFWRLLHEGRETVGDIPPDRFDVDGLYDPDPAAPGRILTRRGHFLERVDGFDPEFFGISPREAPSIDPQHRLLLELAWEALDDAGLRVDQLEGRRGGVFVGLLGTDFLQASVQRRPREELDAFFGTGTIASAAAGRLSYHLRWRGPSVVVDTACSSSLVALHLACQSLRLGESDLALTGGVNLILSPELYIFLSRARAIAPDGRCKTFDARADGYARGEGAGLLVLKRLRDAEAAGDRVLAIVRGSAVNHVGASAGFTVPSAEAQEALLVDAFAAANVDPGDVGLIEAHGTGTPLGDPIELRALAAVLGAPGRREPAWVGSVKTNIGHLEAAAGVAGVIKAVLALRHGVIPRHLHFEQPNPAVAWADLPLRVPTQATPWAQLPDARIAGVSSFGMSGINAHVVLQGVAAPAPIVPRDVEVVVLSARTPAGLDALAARVATRLDELDPASFADACATTQRRVTGPARRAVITTGLSEAARTLRTPAPAPASSALAVLLGGAADRSLLSAFAGAVPELAARALEAALRLAPGPAPDALARAAALGPAACALVLGAALRGVLARANVVPERVVGLGPAALGAAVLAGALSFDDAARLLADPAAAVAFEPTTALRGLGDEDVLALVRAAGAAEVATEGAHAGARAALAPRVVLELGAPGGRPTDAWPALARALGSLYAAGAEVAWSAVAAPGARVVSLPGTVFARRRFWPASMDGVARAAPTASTGPWVVPLAAGDAAGLAARARRLVARLDAGIAPGQLAAAEARTHGAARAAVLGETRPVLRDALEALAAGTVHPGVVRAPWAAGTRPRLVWVFAGHGAQHPGMTHDLLRGEPAYRAAVEACHEAVLAAGGPAILDALQPENGALLARVEIAQPALFAVGLGLAALWRSWGVEPDVVVGHSMGEITAAVVAGWLDLADGAHLMTHRAALLARVAGQGAMVLVDVPEAEARALVRPGVELDVALLNGPRTTILSGTRSAVDALTAELTAAGRFWRRIASDVAFHSRQMDALVDPLFDAALGLRPRRGSVELVSTVTTKSLAASDLDARYWTRNLREPVRFAAVAAALLARGPTVFLELSARQVLLPALEPLLAERPGQGLSIASLAKGEPEVRALQRAAGTLHAAGVAVRWTELLPDAPAPPEVLAAGGHPLRGPRLPPIFAADALEWPLLEPPAALGLDDHATGGILILPGAAVVELVLGALDGGAEAWAIGEIFFLTGIPLPALQGTRLGLGGTRGGGPHFRIVSADASRVFVEGELRRATPDAGARLAPPASGVVLAPDALYAALATRGLAYGPRFRLVTSAEVGEDALVVTVDAPPAPPGMACHPAALDACLHAVALFGDAASSWLPVRMTAVELVPFEGPVTCVIRVEASSGERVRAAVEVRSGERVVFRAQALELRRVVTTVRARDDRYVAVVPEALGPASGGRQRAPWLVVAPPGRRGSLLVEVLRAVGGDSILVDTPAEPTVEAWTRALAPLVPGQGVVWWEPAAEVGPGAAERAVTLVRSAVALTRALLGRPERDPPRLCFVTEGAQAAPGRAVSDPIAAALWGFARTLFLEHPQLAPARIDLDPFDPALTQVTRLADELTSVGEDDEIVHDRGRRLALRLVRGAAPPDRGYRELAEGGARLCWEGDGWTLRSVPTRPPAPGQAVVHVVAVEVDAQRDEALVLVVGRVAGEPDHRVWLAPSGEVASRMCLPADAGVPCPGDLAPGRVVAELRAVMAAVDAILRARIARPGPVYVGGVGMVVDAIAQLFAYDGRPTAEHVRAAIVVCGPEAQHGELLARLTDDGLWIDLGATRSARAPARAIQLLVDPDEVVARPPDVLRPLIERALASMRGLSPLADAPTPALATLASWASDRAVTAVRYEPLLVAHAVGEPIGLRADRAYLISGGLGGLGLRAAAWLAARGARHVVLLSRSGVTMPDQRDALAALGAAGVTVTAPALGVEDLVGLRALVLALARGGTPIGGVIHAAGVLDDAAIEQQDEASIRTVLAPKVAGVLALDAATHDQPVDWFVSYSSVASVLGSAGQANYAAANAVLDAIASWRVERGRPAASVSLGAVAAVGLAARAEQAGARLAARGFLSTAPEELDRVLERVLRTDRPHVGFVELDLRAWLQFFPRVVGSGYLRRLTAEAQGGAAAGTGLLRGELATLSAEARDGALEAFVLAQLGEVLRMDPRTLSRDGGLIALGLDSLLGLELRNRLERALGTSLPVSFVFANPTPLAIASALARLLDGGQARDEAPGTEPAAGTAEAATDGLDEELSDDELLARAAELLE